MTGLPRHKYYLRKDRFGDITCLIEVLGLADQGMVRVCICTTRAESLTECRISLFDTEWFSPVEEISYWVNSKICDLGSISRMIKCENFRYRTNDLGAVTIIKTVAGILKAPTEIIMCDWPSYRWEDPNKSIDTARAIWASALDHCTEPTS